MIWLPYISYGRQIHREINDDSCSFKVVVVGVVVAAAAAADNKNNNNNHDHDNNDSFQDTSKCTINIDNRIMDSSSVA